MGHKKVKVGMKYQLLTPSHKIEAGNELDKVRKIFTPKVTPKKVF